MKLVSSAGSDRAWVWTVQADFADEEPKVEQLAIRFKNSESKEILTSHTVCSCPLVDVFITRFKYSRQHSSSFNNFGKLNNILTYCL